MSFTRLWFLLFSLTLAGTAFAVDAEKRLTGDWILDSAKREARYRFNANGTFQGYGIVDGKANLVIASKWRIDGELLQLFDMTLPFYSRETSDYGLKFDSDDAITLTEKSSGLVTHWKRTHEPMPSSRAPARRLPPASGNG